MKFRRVFLIFFVMSLVLFWQFSRVVKRGSFNDFDFAVTVKIQDRVAAAVGERFDGILEDMGFFASPLFSVVATGAVCLWLFFRQKGFKRKFLVLVIPLGLVLLTLAEIYGKSVVHHPAPAFFLLKNPTTIFPKYHVWEEFSYPSGHAARAVFIAAVVWLLVAKKITQPKKKTLIGIGLGLYAGLIIISRIYLGHHWFSDIVGGSFLGLAMSLVPFIFL